MNEPAAGRMPLNDDVSIVEEALACARRGWPVVPLHGIVDGRCTCQGRANCRPGKHPISSGWQQHATTDEAAIRKMFDGTVPVNLGIATGRRSGLVVLDVDPRNGGEETLEELRLEHGPIPETVTVQTGGGGWHLYFRWSGQGRLRTGGGTIGPGVDVLGEGHLAVGPGSRHVSGGVYTWELCSHPDDVPLAPAPAWLCAGAPLPGTRRQRPASTPSVDRDPLAALDGVEQGQRHNAVFTLCCSLRARRSPEDLIEQLALHAATHCRPPLPESEALDIARDVIGRYAAGTGRDRARGPSDERVAVIRAIAAGGVPARVEEVARCLRWSTARTRTLMKRMAHAGELVRVARGQYVIGSTSLDRSSRLPAGPGPVLPPAPRVPPPREVTHFEDDEPGDLLRVSDVSHGSVSALSDLTCKSQVTQTENGSVSAISDPSSHPGPYVGFLSRKRRQEMEEESKRRCLAALDAYMERVVQANASEAPATATTQTGERSSE